MEPAGLTRLADRIGSKIRGWLLPRAPRIIHLSDLHATPWAHTLDFPALIDNQDSKQKLGTIAAYLTSRQNKARLGARIIVITGDLTDTGDVRDYTIVTTFIQQLRTAGYEVHAVPGNHDYCWEGMLAADRFFHRLKAALGNTALLPALVIPVVASTLAVMFPGIVIPGAVVTAIAIGVITGTIDTADRSVRRQRFAQFITPTDSGPYPRVMAIQGGYLLLLDSMQGQLDESPADLFAQGRLGEAQLTRLEGLLAAYQRERAAGQKVVVCLHHSPFLDDSGMRLADRDRFLRAIAHKVDCLLFGHATPRGSWQQGGDEIVPGLDLSRLYGIPLISCVNLNAMAEKYPIVLLDLARNRRTVFDARSGGPSR